MSATNRLSILYVDDEPGVRAVVKANLERDSSGISCTVTTEEDPERALSVIDSSGPSFDCVISDYNMPRMDGIEFLKAVRECRPGLPVLLFTGVNTADIAAEIIEARLTDYLKKDFRRSGMAMLIHRVKHSIDSDGKFDSDSDVRLDGIGVVGEDERFETVDDTYASLHGYSAEEVAGKLWTALHPTDEVKHIRTHVFPVIENGGIWTGRSEGLRADGSTFTESKMVTALNDGRLLIAVSEIDDVRSFDQT